MSLKEKIKSKFGTMLAASVETGINYYRISQIVNGWVTPNPTELRSLGIFNEYASIKKRGSRGTSSR